jgi:hypothetical protein
VPPGPMASSALSMRLVQTWFNSPAKPWISGSSSSKSWTSRTFLSRRACPSITSVCSSPLRTSTGSGSGARSMWE